MRIISYHASWRYTSLQLQLTYLINGTFAINFGGSVSANRVLASPNGSAGAPSWRSLVVAVISGDVRVVFVYVIFGICKDSAGECVSEIGKHGVSVSRESGHIQCNCFKLSCLVSLNVWKAVWIWVGEIDPGADAVGWRNAYIGCRVL